MHCPRSSLPVAEHTIGWALVPGDVDPSPCPGERERESICGWAFEPGGLDRPPCPGEREREREHQMPYDPWEDDLDQPEQPAPQQQPPTPYRGQTSWTTQQRHQQPPPQTAWSPHHLQQQPFPHQPQPLQQGGNSAAGQYVPGAGHFQPPTMDPWGFMARHYASQGPLLPPHQWSHNALGLGGRRAPETANPVTADDNEDSTCTTDAPCEEADPLPEVEEGEQEADTGDAPLQDEADDELTDVPDDELEWDSDQPDTEDEDEELASATPATKPGAKAPKRAAGHGSQRVANKAKKSDVKKLWRELGWGKKPKWLSWKAALGYIKRGEQPPAKEPLLPTPSPQREHLKVLLAAHHYSYDAQGRIVPQHPPPTATLPADDRGEKASNQAREDHAKRRATNPYLQPPGARPRPRGTTAPTSTSSSSSTGPTAARAQQQPQQQPVAQHQGRRAQPTTEPQQGATPPQPPQQPQQQAAPRQQRQVHFQVPEDHREEPPRPIRRQNTWRKLSDSTEVQLRGDGVANYPVQIIDNRPVPAQREAGGSTPDTADQQLYNQFHNVVGDYLVVQPAHLTDYPHEPGSASSSRGPRETPLETGGPSLPDISDLELQAAEAIEAGRAPAVQAEGNGPSMRSSVRVDDNSHDISWVQGVTPATLPPPMPLHPRTILSMRGSATGSWRGSTWSPPSNSLVRHPARLNLEPTVVVYKTLAGIPERGILPDGLQISLHPAGSWIATTRFELGFARTPRYWLVEVDFAPPPVQDRMQLRTGDSFWLEWGVPRDPASRSSQAADTATKEGSYHQPTQQSAEVQGV